MTEVKKCSRCLIEKPANEFYVRRLKRSTALQVDCIECTKAYHKEHYRANKEKYLKSTKTNKKLAYEKINKLKDNPCTDCGNRFPPEAMDFDHINYDKEYSIAMLVGMNSMTKALSEIEKCELVCANCHRIRTKLRIVGGIGTQLPAK